MSIRPVSFGSLMVFTLNDGKPKADVPTLVKTAFNNNEQLREYSLKDGFKHEEQIDGTVHNASKNFARTLDKKYQKQLPKGSKQVNLTEADFSVNPRETQKRYFLTASTKEEENALLKILSQGSTLYVAQFN